MLPQVEAPDLYRRQKGGRGATPGGSPQPLVGFQGLLSSTHRTTSLMHCQLGLLEREADQHALGVALGAGPLHDAACAERQQRLVPPPHQHRGAEGGAAGVGRVLRGEDDGALRAQLVDCTR